MPRQRGTTPPRYRPHKASGQAIVTLNLPDGTREDVYLGPFDSPESKRKYVRAIADWKAAWKAHRDEQKRKPVDPVLDLPPANPDAFTVAELIIRFYRHVQAYYVRPDGTPTKEVTEFKYTLKILRIHFGELPANDFGPLKLKELRERMIDVGWSRKLINRRIGRVRQCFKWGVSQELVKPEMEYALKSLAPLQAGRSKAKERPKVRPVNPKLVKQTLPHLSPTLQAFVRVLLFCGARCGELCIMRLRDIDRSRKVWIYRPESHKTAHHGHERRIALGKRCQRALEPLLAGLKDADYVFSPRRAWAAFRADQRAKRRSPMTPSQRARTPKENPLRAKGERYKPDAIGHAVTRACKRGLLPHWHPHQLRHTFGSIVRKRFGLDAARAAMGQKTAAVADHYAEIEGSKIVQVAEQIG